MKAKCRSLIGLIAAAWTAAWDFVVRTVMRGGKFLRDFACAVCRALLKHFRTVAIIFAVLMLAVAGCAGWFTVRAVGVRSEIRDQAYQVEYNQGRVRLQMYEYRQAEEAIPKLREQLEAIRQKAEETAAAKLEQRKAAPSMFRGSYKGISAAKKDAEAQLKEAKAAESLAREELDSLLQSVTGGEQP